MPSTLADRVAGWRPALDDAVRVATAPRLDEVGRVEHLGDGVAFVSGLPGLALDELVRFADGTLGLTVELAPHRASCLVLGPDHDLAAGGVVHGTGALARVPVGDGLLGRVVDPLGHPLDEAGPVEATRLEPVERPAPGIADRDLVSEPLYTGVGVIDAMFPIGRGQRELIIGDRATGKTAIAVDAVLSQRASDVVCVYVAIGQKSSSVAQVIDAVRRHGPVERTVFVVAEAETAPGLQWLAPYAGATIAEHVRDAGGHALLILDDLTRHAAIHRQIALLLRQPPGREAFPGDVFHVHSRLLERAAKLAPRLGGGSLTALPIAETQAGNLSAFIPTNLISITDGQIALDSRLFEEGQLPAVDVGKSVSRVGGKTQAPVMRDLAQHLRLEYAQALELEVFARFGATADARTRSAVEHGHRIRALLRQPRLAPLPVSVQVGQLLALARGILDRLSPEGVTRFRTAMPNRLRRDAPRIVDGLDQGAELGADDADALARVLDALASEVASPAPETAAGAG
ncbi:MAG: F0F1 ATP synthase subunit alpha [Ectothiorhodospiraceae bacterium]|nr:F0F1 ATP synthase subunit alpha [Ectothiorhodospiraceae bacterium]